jgi:hypothetical protein
MKTPELPDWNYTVEEVSMGVYQLKGIDKQGRIVDLTGTDPDKLIQEFITSAKHIDLTK